MYGDFLSKIHYVRSSKTTIMDFKSLVLNRQSDRSYLDKPVETDKLVRILECARMAPSACNAQPWHIIVADNPEIRDGCCILKYAAGIPGSGNVPADTACVPGQR